MNNLWQVNHEFSTGGDRLLEQARLRFMSGATHELLTANKAYTISRGLLAVADAVAGVMTESSIASPFPLRLSVSGKLPDGSGVFVIVGTSVRDEYGDDDEDAVDMPKGPARIDISVTGTREAASLIFSALDKAFGGENHAGVQWWYKTGPSAGSRRVYLPPIATTLAPEFYPDMKDPNQFLRDFLEAPEAVLLLAGPPGTGKTTLLRHMICDHRLSAHVIYDEDLMKNDGIFQSFLFDGDGDVMIIEDADTVLTAREAGDNKLMARFLNMSDGLIKLPNKKLVFTTNISDFGRVDSALLRPGRCFGVLHTRALNLTEAQAAAKVASLPIPLEKREYTLAELFNQGNRSSDTVRRIGFSGR